MSVHSWDPLGTSALSCDERQVLEAALQRADVNDWNAAHLGVLLLGAMLLMLLDSRVYSSWCCLVVRLDCLGRKVTTPVHI